MFRLPLISFLALFCGSANAADIGLVGVFPGKAVLVIDGAAPKTYAMGALVAPDTRLVAADQEGATLVVSGKRQRIMLGDYVNHAPATGLARVTLQADGRGHFVAQGQINGGSVRLLVDTGATLIALPAQDAIRLGIDYKKGQRDMVNTANGLAPAYRTQLDTVQIGDILLNQVDAVVQENGLPYALLGMSFLKRTEMHRDGEQMTLTKRF